MTAVYYGAMYGGRISSILLNIPGDEPAMMTTLTVIPWLKKAMQEMRLFYPEWPHLLGHF